MKTKGTIVTCDAEGCGMAWIDDVEAPRARTCVVCGGDFCSRHAEELRIRIEAPLYNKRNKLADSLEYWMLTSRLVGGICNSCLEKRLATDDAALDNYVEALRVQLREA